MQAKDIGHNSYLLQRAEAGHNAYLAAFRAHRGLKFLQWLDALYLEHPQSHAGDHRRNIHGDKQSAMHLAAGYQGNQEVVKWLLAVDPGLKACETDKAPWKTACRCMELCTGTKPIV